MMLSDRQLAYHSDLPLSGETLGFTLSGYSKHVKT